MSEQGETQPDDRSRVIGRPRPPGLDETVRLDAAIVKGTLSLPSRFGRYQVLRRIGAGGFASVYAAFDPELESEVAIKVLAENHSANTIVRQRFVAEARVARRLGNDRLIGVFDLGESDDGRPFVVMELATRGTLRNRLVRTGRPDRDDLLRLIDELGACLSAIHAKGIVHRDIKPSNLLFRVNGSTEGTPARLIEDDEQLVLADFGLARDISSGASAVTIGGGTEGYMAPEQADTDGKPDVRADLYAATVVVAELTTGRHPQRLDLTTADISTPMLEALTRSLAIDREQRPDSAEAWRNLLHRAYAQDRPGGAPAVSIDEDATTIHGDGTAIMPTIVGSDHTAVQPQPQRPDTEVEADTDTAADPEVEVEPDARAAAGRGSERDAQVPAPPPPGLPVTGDAPPPPDPERDALEERARVAAARAQAEAEEREAARRAAERQARRAARAERREQRQAAVRPPAGPTGRAGMADADGARGGDSPAGPGSGSTPSTAGQGGSGATGAPPGSGRAGTQPATAARRPPEPAPPQRPPATRQPIAGQAAAGPSVSPPTAPQRPTSSPPVAPAGAGTVRPPTAPPQPPPVGPTVAPPATAPGRPHVGPTGATGARPTVGGPIPLSPVVPSGAVSAPLVDSGEEATRRSRQHLRTAAKLAKLERKQARKQSRKARRRRRRRRTANVFLALIRGGLAAMIMAVIATVVAESAGVDPNAEGPQGLIAVAIVVAFLWGLAYFPFPRSYDV